MNNQPLKSAPIQVSTLGVHFMAPEDLSLYEAAKAKIDNVQSQADAILAEAEVQKRDILAKAQTEHDAILEAARKTSLEQSAAEIVCFKAQLEETHRLELSKIEGRISDVLESITQYLFSNSSKAEFIVSQIQTIAQSQLLDPSNLTKTVIRANNSCLKQVSEVLQSQDDTLMAHFSFVVSEEPTDKVTLELGERNLVINPDDFLHQLNMQFGSEAD